MTAMTSGIGSPLGQGLNARGPRHVHRQFLAGVQLQVVTLGREHEDGPGARSRACPNRGSFSSAGDRADDRTDSASYGDLPNVATRGGCRLQDQWLC
jgi:hypothetical protein